jgi:hypothetical protein
MFTAEDIANRIKSQPFVPVRIATSDGQSYDVYHPDLVMVGRRAIIVGTASAESPSHFDLVSRLAIIHITSLADLPTPAKHGGNGKH